MKQRDFGVLDAHPLPAGGDGSIPIKSLRFVEVSSGQARRCVAAWHRTLPSIGAVNTMKVCYGAKFDGDLYAVAMWSNPVARMLPQRTWLELRRFAISDHAPSNTASRMLGWMRRELRRRYPEVERAISYQDCENHDGIIYRAAGWECHPVAPGGQWKNRQRSRTATRIQKKNRWELPLLQRRSEQRTGQ